MNRIMIVDDEQPILSALKRVLSLTPCSFGGRKFDLRVETFTSPREALARMGSTAFDLILSDYRMPEMSGVEFLGQARQLQPDTARLILSGYADLNALVAAINEAQIARFIAKPWNDYELVATLAQVLAMRELELENRRLADEARLARGVLRPDELERKRLEHDEPGITRVDWGPDGSVILDRDLLGE